MTKVIIAGSRGIEDYNLLCEIVEKAIKILKIKPTEIVSGAAKGVDMLGEKWARDNGVNLVQFYAKWNDTKNCEFMPKFNAQGKAYNPRAGFDRNQEMAEYADALIAINIGDTPGTNDMVKRAKKENLLVYKYSPEPLEDEFDYEF